jgi:hypothetical protein
MFGITLYGGRASGAVKNRIIKHLMKLLQNLKNFVFRPMAYLWAAYNSQTKQQLFP